jgi:hypothetical protein
MRSMTRRFAVALAVAGLLVAVGCAKDATVSSTDTTTPVTASSGGGGAGTTEPDEDVTDTTDPEDADKDKGKGTGSGEYAEACTAIEGLEALDDADEDDSDQTFALMEEARDAGPDELVDHWDTLIDVLGELDALGESDEAMTKALELLDDPEFLEAAAAIDDFAEEECGLDIDLDPAEESDVPGGRTNDDEIGAPSNGSKDPTSVASVKAFLADEYGSEVWWPVLEDASGWSYVNTNDPMWTIKLSASSDWETLTIEELEAACDAVAEHLDTVVDSDAAVEILDPDDVELVSRYFRGEACAADEGF